MDEKLAALAHLNRVLENILNSKTLYCHQGCAACCTLDVIMTTLEGYQIITHLNQSNRIELLDRIPASDGNQTLYRPRQTINALAARCAENEAVFEEHAKKGLGVCPLLINDRCSIYPARPLACRTMVSSKDCRLSGYAAMDPFILSVTNVLFQFGEHIDQGGLTGNLSDILLYLSKEKNHRAYENGVTITGAEGLIPNQPLTVLMVPPEHRQPMAPVLMSLNPAMDDII